ncbi:hypothetical protein B9Z19DRAFT_1105157 [Tuber borchii]|uniref:LEA domain protein n=1 Tax=Tuber borchii TaxID=42251 RepID=A0A2T7A6Z6_TUBBO|nr:hypothetical protein B9Z19DRAFT_1105157 [Tuber borchii]
MTTLLRLRLPLRLPKPTRTTLTTCRRHLTTTPTLSRTITDSAKDAVKTIDRAAGTAALKGIQTGEAIAETAKRTVSGATERAEGVGGEVAGKAKGTAAEAAGKAKGTAAEAAGKAYEVGGKARGMKEEAKSGNLRPGAGY